MITEIISLCVASYLVNGCSSLKLEGLIKAKKKSEFKNDGEFEDWYQKEKKSIEDKLNSDTIKVGMERWNTGGNNSLYKTIKPELEKLKDKYIEFYNKALEYKIPKINKNENCFTGSWDNYNCEQKKTLIYCDNSKKINPDNRNKVKKCCGDICETFIELRKIKNKLMEYDKKLKEFEKWLKD